MEKCRIREKHPGSATLQKRIRKLMIFLLVLPQKVIANIACSKQQREKQRTLLNIWDGKVIKDDRNILFHALLYIPKQNIGYSNKSKFVQ
jgi:hypothetical protein